MDEAVMAAIQEGFTSLSGMIKSVILVGVPASIGVLALSQGAKYGIRWVRGLISKA